MGEAFFCLIEICSRLAGEFFNFIKREFRKEAQKAFDILVVHIAPVLPIVPRFQMVVTEPNRAIGGLAHLFAIVGEQKGGGESKGLALCEAANQINARRDIAPLV